MKSKNTLRQLYTEHDGKVSDKWNIYLTEYERIFEEYKDEPIKLLEIGIQNGGSIEIWSKYFQKAENLVGCDINPDCARLKYSDPRITVVIGNANLDITQSKILSNGPIFDLIIDDGSHLSSDIVKSFVRYFPYLADNGVFIVEDLHASYWQAFEGGLFDPFSSISFFKRLTDFVNYEHWGINKAPADILNGFGQKYDLNMNQDAFRHIHSIEFINSMCVIRKSSPEHNQLAPRFIAGKTELVVPGHLKLHGLPLGSAPDQTSNFWTARSTPPDEEFLPLVKELGDRDRQIVILNEAIAERNSQIEYLNEGITKIEAQIARLDLYQSTNDVRTQDEDVLVTNRPVKTIAVAFLARGADVDWHSSCERFLGSYLRYNTGIEHSLYVIFKGFPDESALEKAGNLFSNVVYKPVFLADNSFDIGAYIEWANQIDEDLICMLNTSSEILAEDWLLKLAENLALPNVGLVGATGSYESLHEFNPAFPTFPNIHIRSNAFMINRDAFCKITKGQVIGNKWDAYNFESGTQSITQRILAMDQKILIVGSNGQGYSPKLWPNSDTFRLRAQNNLLIADNHTRTFAAIDWAQKKDLAHRAWGQAAQMQQTDEINRSRSEQGNLESNEPAYTSAASNAEEHKPRKRHKKK